MWFYLIMIGRSVFKEYIIYKCEILKEFKTEVVGFLKKIYRKLVLWIE